MLVCAGEAAACQVPAAGACASGPLILLLLGPAHRARLLPWCLLQPDLAALLHCNQGAAAPLGVLLGPDSLREALLA